MNYYHKYYENGITVKELKKILADIPDVGLDGEDTEVWISTGVMTSSPAHSVCKLNYRQDCEPGSTGESWDLLIN